ncbi:hypothetical protein WN55_02281 [Dufourea novaeangliae]|uniref:Uncharacterized protein n=1 Tax=Dufourea novaeangliae TaxID=178035 RepID=A0A154PG36_DUFNO|nr:hypothetical protein WN55_02281 [Dufourea novaeangliae]
MVSREAKLEVWVCLIVDTLRTPRGSVSNDENIKGKNEINEKKKNGSGKERVD